MQNLSRRGLHGTALEYAKLLLGLDPSDPRGVLFCIDYLAIRAHQYKILRVRLCLKLSMVHAFFLSFGITLSAIWEYDSVVVSFIHWFDTFCTQQTEKSEVMEHL